MSPQDFPSLHIPSTIPHFENVSINATREGCFSSISAMLKKKVERKRKEK